jgi:hypothetical protein
MTRHDTVMNRYVIELRRDRVRQGIKSLRHYRQTRDALGQQMAASYVRAVLADYCATVKALRS